MAGRRGFHDTSLDKYFIILVIARKFCSIYNAVPENICAPRCPKTFDSLMLYYFTVTIQAATVCHCIFIQWIPLILESNLYYISRVSNSDCKGPSEHSCEDLLVKQRILTMLEWSTYVISDWLI